MNKPASNKTVDELTYPFGKHWSPEPGKPHLVSEGVYWLRMPLPIALDHINLWLIEDGDSWVIVDSGYDHPSCEAVWEQVFDKFLKPEQVNKIIVTHFHPDHIGLAAWLAKRCDCKVLMTQGEFGFYRKILERDPVEAATRVQQFFKAAGFDETTVNKIQGFFAVDDRPAERRLQKDQVTLLQEGQPIQIGNGEWRVVIGNGHSPEHACLYNERLDVLISGDQAIPRISSNVSLHPGNQRGNPLDDWISSCEKLLGLFGHNTLVLPSHQEPFQGLPLRMKKLLVDHKEQLDDLRDILQESHTALEATRKLFPRELGPVDLVLAVGETLANLKYLSDLGELKMIDTEDVRNYEAV